MRVATSSGCHVSQSMSLTGIKISFIGKYTLVGCPLPGQRNYGCWFSIKPEMIQSFGYPFEGARSPGRFDHCDRNLVIEEKAKVVQICAHSEKNGWNRCRLTALSWPRNGQAFFQYLSPNLLQLATRATMRKLVNLYPAILPCIGIARIGIEYGVSVCLPT